MTHATRLQVLLGTCALMFLAPSGGSDDAAVTGTGGTGATGAAGATGGASATGGDGATGE